MKAKVQYLFEMNKLLVRPTPEQRDFEDKNRLQLSAFVEAVEEGFNKTRLESIGKEILEMNFLWFANCMNGNVLAAFGRQFPELVKPTGRKNHCILLKGGFECYIKKLTDGLLPSYNHSDTTEAMIEQLALPKQKPLPVIFLGYTLNKTNERITGIYAVCVKGNERLWVSDLSTLEPPATGDRFGTPIAPNSPSPDIQVTPKKKRKAQ